MKCLSGLLRRVMLEKITVQNIHWVMAALKQNKAYYSKGSEVQKSANVLHFNVWIVSDYLFHCFFQSLHIFKVTALQAVAYFLRTKTFHGFFVVAKTATTCVQASSFTIFNLRVLLNLIWCVGQMSVAPRHLSQMNLKPVHYCLISHTSEHFLTNHTYVLRLIKDW